MNNLCSYCGEPDSGLNEFSLCPPCDEIIPYNDPLDCVYFISAPNGLVKIGKSRRVKNRLIDLKRYSPVPLKLERIIALAISEQSFMTYSRLEWNFHRRFAEDRKHGEWFDINMDEEKWLFEIDHNRSPTYYGFIYSNRPPDFFGVKASELAEHTREHVPNWNNGQGEKL